MELSHDEYSAIKSRHRNLILIPSDSMEDTLTTGTLGNGNRIMLPNKILKKHKIEKLRKKVRSSIIEIDDNKFLIIELEKADMGIPVFKGDEKDE
jgi:hypothetical protein